MMIAPVTISCTQLARFIFVQPLATTVMIKAPMSEPKTLPSPPFKLAPPMTTAAITASSSPFAVVGSPTVR